MKCVFSIRGSNNLIILVERASACGDILYCFKKKKKKAFLDYLQQGGGALQLTLHLGHLCEPLEGIFHNYSLI